jgi:hypothetical protein
MENVELLSEMDDDDMDINGPDEWGPNVDLEEDLDLDLEAQLPWRNVDPIIYFRFSWDEIDYLIHLLRFPAIFRTETRLRMSAKEAFCLLTYRLSHTSRWIDIMLLFPRSISALSQLFREVVDFMYYTWRHLLLFDHVRLTPAYLRTLANTIKEKGGADAIPNIWGFIDGTHVRVSRPDHDQDEVYSGQKKCHSLKYQAIATPDGLIAHLGGPFSG